jgi:AcrR family transcriptional regulator
MSEQEWIIELLNTDKGNDIKYSEKQLKIIEAAIDIFSEKGFAATSTSEIAKKAGVAEGTIFRHYKTKKDLLISIVTPFISKLIAPHFAKDFVKNVLDQKYDSYENLLRTLAKNRYLFVKNNFPILKIFIQEIAFHKELRDPYFQLFKTHIYPKFEEQIKYFQSKGELVDLPPETILRLSFTSIAGAILSQYVTGKEEWNYEGVIDPTIKFVMKGLTP